MKVLIFSDIHGNTRQLEKLVATPADIYIAAGDLSNFGKVLDRCGEIMKPLGERLDSPWQSRDERAEHRLLRKIWLH